MLEETAEDFAKLAAEFREKFRPADATERFLVDTLIHNQWRLRRLRLLEAKLWENAATVTPDIERLQRIVDSCSRNYHRALKELVARAPDQAQVRRARWEKNPAAIEAFGASFQSLVKQ